MYILLPVQERHPLLALRAFLRQLLERGVVDLVLSPLRTPDGTITPALVSDPHMLVYADPLAPVLPGNAAALAGKLSFKEPRPRVGVVLRACELRALVELTKMQQASLKDLMLIAVDCPGAYSVADFQRAGLGEEQKGLAEWRRLWQMAVEHPEAPDPDLRMACKICEQPVFSQAQARIELFGSPVDSGIWIWLAPELAERLDYSEQAANGSQERAAILERLTAARSAARDAAFADIRARLEGKAGIQGVFAACIRCHNA